MVWIFAIFVFSMLLALQHSFKPNEEIDKYRVVGRSGVTRASRRIVANKYRDALL